MDKEPYMTDAQLSAILVAILDILTAMNAAYADDHGQADAIAKARALIANTKPIAFGGFR